MDVTVTPLPKTSQVELAITITPEELEPHLDRAAKQLSQGKPLKGFRPGKAPVDVVVDALGEEAVLHKALESGVPRFFVQAVLEQNIEALGRPATTVTKAGMKEGLQFTARVDVLPEVKLGDPSIISVTQRSVEVTDTDIEQELTVLAKSRSTYLEVARPAETGDTVQVDFEVFMDGSSMEGGASKNHPVHLGEGHFIPDFEHKIVGMQAGDERTFPMTFPDDFATKDLRGKQVEAKVKAHSVQKRVIPKLDDAFAKSLGAFASLDDLKKKLRENMEHERAHKEDERVQGELTQQLAAGATFGALPESLIEREIDRRMQELTQMLQMQGKTLADYLASRKKTETDIRAELRASAIETVKVSLALRQFAQDHDIAVSDDDVDAKVQEYLAQFATTDEAKKNINQEELRSTITSMLRNQQSLAKLKEVATVNVEKTPAPTEALESKS